MSTVVKPLILVRFSYSSLSGGYKRLYEILKRGKTEGIDYIVITDPKSCENAVKIFPDFMKVLEQYKVFMQHYKENKTKISIFRQLHSYKRIFSLALFVSRVARSEKVDLLISPGEETSEIITCYLSSLLCSKPWTAIFQGTNDLLQPVPELSSINIIKVIRHINSKASFRRLPFTSKIGLAIDLLELLRIAEKSLMLTISYSLVKEVQFLNPKIKFYVINPGNGINYKVINYKREFSVVYDAIFFSRFVPNKGVFDLPEIWRHVVKHFPNAKLAVVAIIEDVSLLEKFEKALRRYGLAKNIAFLGPKNERDVIRLTKSSKLTLYPSTLDVLPLTILESLACGTPVVAYDILAIKDAFHECKAVIRCPVKNYTAMAETIIDLLKNEELRSKLSEEAYMYSRKFDWAKVVRAEKFGYQKVIDLYNTRFKR